MAREVVVIPKDVLISQRTIRLIRPRQKASPSVTVSCVKIPRSPNARAIGGPPKYPTIFRRLLSLGGDSHNHKPVEHANVADDNPERAAVN